jgi:hypothetical protein
MPFGPPIPGETPIDDASGLLIKGIVRSRRPTIGITHLSFNSKRDTRLRLPYPLNNSNSSRQESCEAAKLRFPSISG